MGRESSRKLRGRSRRDPRLTGVDCMLEVGV